MPDQWTVNSRLSAELGGTAIADNLQNRENGQQQKKQTRKCLLLNLLTENGEGKKGCSSVSFMGSVNDVDWLTFTSPTVCVPSRTIPILRYFTYWIVYFFYQLPLISLKYKSYHNLRQIP